MALNASNIRNLEQLVLKGLSHATFLQADVLLGLNAPVHDLYEPSDFHDPLSALL